MEPDQRPAIVRPRSRSAPDRRARPGSHSRPSYSRCRTARARRSAASAPPRRRRRARRRRGRSRRVKSRAQCSWPGQSGSAGWSTRATCGCSFSQRATLSPFSWCRCSRTSSVRRPRSASQASSGPAGLAEHAPGPLQPLGIGLGRGHRAEHQIGMAADIFGAGEDREIDAGRDRREEERRRPGIVEQGDEAPRLRRRADRRARPAPRSVCVPGLSMKTARVFSPISAAMPAPISGS